MLLLLLSKSMHSFGSSTVRRQFNCHPSPGPHEYPNLSRSLSRSRRTLPSGFRLGAYSCAHYGPRIFQEQRGRIGWLVRSYSVGSAGTCLASPRRVAKRSRSSFFFCSCLLAGGGFSFTCSLGKCVLPVLAAHEPGRRHVTRRPLFLFFLFFFVFLLVTSLRKLGIFQDEIANPLQ